MDPLYWTIVVGAALLALVFGAFLAWKMSRRKHSESERAVAPRVGEEQELQRRSNRTRPSPKTQHRKALPQRHTEKDMLNRDEERKAPDTQNRSSETPENEISRDEGRRDHSSTDRPETREQDRRLEPVRDDNYEGHATTHQRSRASSQAGGVAEEATDRAPLFPAEDSDMFRKRWQEIQTHFVDEPRQAVEWADQLVSEVTEHITSVFTGNRDELERQWGEGGEVSTEDLRRTLQRYRNFFQRLLNV